MRRLRQPAPRDEEGVEDADRVAEIQSAAVVEVPGLVAVRSEGRPACGQALEDLDAVGDDEETVAVLSVYVSAVPAIETLRNSAVVNSLILRLATAIPMRAFWPTPATAWLACAVQVAPASIE